MNRVTTRTLHADELPVFFRREGRAFGHRYTPDDQAEITTRLPNDRIVVGEVDGEIVGGGGVFPFRMTLPGGAAVDATGVTFVFVAATHRRRGVLRAVMAELHAQADAYGEPLQVLTASEGGIYERFGYGIATQRRSVVIDRRAARLRPDVPTGGAVSYLDDDDTEIAEVAAVWDAYAADSVAAQTLTPSWWRMALAASPSDPGGPIPEVFVHRDDAGRADGFAVYRAKPSWDHVGATGVVEVDFLVALNPTAECELWRALLGIDLTVTIEADLPPDALLPWLLEDPRAVRTIAQRDGLWARPGQVRPLLAARAWPGAEDMVVDVGPQGRWTLCGTQTDAPADITLGESTLGTCLFGAVSPTLLAAAGRLQASSPAALDRFEQAVCVPRAPFLHRGF